MSARERLLKQFRELVGMRLERINRQLMELEAGSNPEARRGVLRELHGLKGEARMMGFDDINALVHEMEELVRAAERTGYVLSGASTDMLLQAADAVLVLAGVVPAPEQPPEVKRLVRALKERAQEEAAAPEPAARPQPAAPPAPARAPVQAPAAPVAGSLAVEPVRAAAPAPAALPAPPQAPAARPVDPVQAPATAAATTALGRLPAPEPARSPAQRAAEARADGSVRIGVASLDLLTSGVTNLTQVARRRELAHARRLELAQVLSRLAREAEDLGPAGAALAERLAHAKELAAALHREAKLLSNEELRDLRLVAEEVQRLRMLPLSVLFEPYPRMVRDLARELGKEVELVVEGEDTRADRAVVEALRDPLLHLVRNALDHGLESRVERVAAGKHPRGRLRLGAAREGNRLVLRVEDDGVGLEPALLRRVAVRRGLLDEASAGALTDAAARELIFLSGFTSRESATDLSGRGVGLDAVRSSMRALGGDVLVESVPGRGTRFELRVPVSLTVTSLLFVQVGEETLCLSAAHVSHALRLDEQPLRRVAGRPVLEVEGKVLPLASLAALLGLEPEHSPAAGQLALVINSQGSAAALAVDRVLAERVQAILPLKGLLAHFVHLSGATLMAGGRLSLVLSAAHLIAGARGATPLLRSPRVVRKVEPAARRRILVVDDSPLTRELVASLLRGVGYEVQVASDGERALGLLEGGCQVELVVTDLEMPVVDGLELTRLLKAHPALHRLPVVILTTRGGEEDRRRGLEAGADGYVTKGDLVRQDLVDVVGRLLS